ncbi:uncharacterized protein LOC129720027 isoform X2 [Wyeomyia smithii]|uniref:uncharacterized protein LOC129720027 isoform X2 n=1 Tax=Wyeomyia smithii TaxID=174621 RepID=UPI00246803AE|nr:uncharacterized protein LOC129720027 isoform X2 [Wyeomyia smithii]
MFDLFIVVTEFIITLITHFFYFVLAKLHKIKLVQQMYKAQSYKAKSLSREASKLIIPDDESEHLRIEFIGDMDVSNVAHAARAYGFPAIQSLPLVRGFNFPIPDEDTVELLEATVKANAQIRKEYIKFLKAKKPKSVKIINAFHALFQDEAMYSFNYSGICHRGPRRKAMQSYDIFADCMLEAWREHGIDQTALKEGLTLAIKNINGRKRNRKYFARKKIRNEMLIHDN